MKIKTYKQNGYIDDDVVGLLALIAVVIMVGSIIIGILSWGQGHANSAYLKQTQGIDLPWYQAAWLTVDINDSNIKLKVKP